MRRLFHAVALYMLLLFSWQSWSAPMLPSEDAITHAYGRGGMIRVVQWQQLMMQSKADKDDVKLASVNDFFNRLAFLDDTVVWGLEDYWATPVEFLGADAGDCEDFTMAKYQTLRMLGVDDSKLRIHYVKYVPYDQFHMVLTYTSAPGAMPVVLDNIRRDIVPASQRNDLTPVYSFNGKDLWIARLDQPGQRVGGAGRLSMWEEWMVRVDNGTLRPLPH